MSTLADAARSLLERKGKATTELTLDGTNKVSFPDQPYKLEALGKKIIVAIDIFKSGYECRACAGKGTQTTSAGIVLTCPDCKGRGFWLELPQTSKSLPTTGVVVSIGNRCNLEKLGYKIGDRIVFGPYAGSMLPTKLGLMFKILDWNQAWATVEGAEELGAFDFVMQAEVS
jgi:co-chaperonin GroES (HSP10)